MIKLYEIVPFRLYQSAYTHQMSSGSCVELVNTYDLTAVINVWTKPDPRISALVKTYAHKPLIDGRLRDKTIESANILASEISAEIDLGGCVLVHCLAGRNRSALVVGLTLKKLFANLSGKLIVDHICRVRPGALANQHFRRYLLEGS